MVSINMGLYAYTIVTFYMSIENQYRETSYIIDSFICHYII